MNNLFKRILSSILLITLLFYIIFFGSYTLFLFIFICFFVSIYEWYKMTKNKFLRYSGYLFLFFSFYTFYIISFDLNLILFVMLICVSTDIGGYVFGKIFKGPKLIKISPKKTYSGMFGGYFLSFTNLVIVSNFTDKVEVSTYFFILVLIISTISQIGDIIISYFKRLSKIKDTGKLIPGHGGILDRIDGMIFVFPIIFLIKLFGFINI